MLSFLANWKYAFLGFLAITNLGEGKRNGAGSDPVTRSSKRTENYELIGSIPFLAIKNLADGWENLANANLVTTKCLVVIMEHLVVNMALQ